MPLEEPNQPPADPPDSSASAILDPPPLPRGDASPGVVVVSEENASGEAHENGAASTALPDDRTVISQRPPVDVPSSPARSSQHLGQSLIGKTLEHYELVEFVGGGGMGAVFRANDTRLGRTVAVKVLSRDQTDDETIRRFRNEAQSAARLDHPNIARVHYVGEDHGWNFIVFEFIEGVNLRDLVQSSGPLPLEDALYFTLQVAEALAHSSSRDVVHRDIKPSNVLVMSDATVKLVDMGLARLHQVESSSDDLTASGVTLGTFDYISPEQARDPRLADVRSDIYSLGCTLYYILTGRPPFPDGTALQKLIRHSQDDPEDVRLSRPDLSPRVSALLARMLAKRPSQRPQTAQNLVAEIVSVAEHAGLSRIVHRGNAIAAPAARQELWAKALQVAIAAVILIAAVVALDSLAPGPAATHLPAARPKLQPAAAGAADTPATTIVQSGIDSPNKIAKTSPAAAATSQSNQANQSAASNTVAGRVEIAASGSPKPAQTPKPAAPIEPPAVEVSALAAAAKGSESLAAIGPPAISGGIGIPPADAAIAVLGSPAAGLASPAAKIKRLVVARAVPAQVAADAEYQTSLAAACQRAGKLGLNEIELEWTGPLDEPPLEIALPKLTLRAVIGYRPIVQFRPKVSLAGSQLQMIRLAAGPTGRLSLQGIGLRLELPAESASGWSLVAMRPGQTLELSGCVLTVQDGDDSRPPMHDQVAMITVQPRPMSETMSMEPAAAMAAGTTIVIDRTIARGEATFVSLPEDTQLALRWSQGLLVTPKRLLETTGSATNPKWFEKISLTLDNVTAACRQGLHQMKRRSGAGYQFGLEVTTNRCILMADSQSPLYEFVGVSEITASDLRCDGELNRYPQPDVTFLRIRPTTPGEQPTTYDLKDRGNWSMESRQKAGVPWRAEPTFDSPAHEQTREDFELDPTAVADAGFDPLQLPSVLPAAEASAAPQPPMPATSSLP